MPDKHGFNHLGDSVRCIDCPVGGPLGHWPEHKRAQHGRAHGRTAPGANQFRRQRHLLTAPPPNSNEEKEATMPPTTQKGVSAKQVAIDVLREAGEPLRASEIAERVLASGRCAGLKGKTPEATISAMLAVGSKQSGGPFKRVDKGTYTLADASTPATTTAKERKPAAATRAPARTTAARSKAKSGTAKSAHAARTRSATKRTR